MPGHGGRDSSNARSGSPGYHASYQRVSAAEAGHGDSGDGSWEDFRRRNRGQLALVSCIGLVLLIGTAKTAYDKLRGPVVNMETLGDVGAPAVTGAPAVKDLDAPGPQGIEGVEKVGAGIMFLAEDQVLLLKRNSLHNHDKWGLPGGNLDDADNDVFAAAQREAVEELGPLPQFSVRGEILTKRGKQDQKHYTVFLASLTPEAKAAFAPQLNEEHSAWQWFALEAAFRMDDLHPVVKRVFKKGAQHRDLVLAAAKPETR